MNNEQTQKNFQSDLAEVVGGILNLLTEKNRKYGDAALAPRRTFSKASVDEQINVRMDDKLNRIQNRQDDDDEDAELDLLGYLILKRISKLRKARADAIGAKIEAEQNVAIRNITAEKEAVSDQEAKAMRRKEVGIGDVPKAKELAPWAKIAGKEHM